MQFFDAFLSAAKSSLANCAITLQNVTSSSSPSLPDAPAADLVTPLSSTSSTSSFPLSSGSSPKRKARHALLQQLPLPGASKAGYATSLVKAKGKARILERFRDGLRSEKSRRRASLSSTPYNSQVIMDHPPCSSTSPIPIPGSTLPQREVQSSRPSTSVDDITMQSPDDVASSPQAAGSTFISCPTPLRPSPRRRPLPTPSQTSTVSNSSSSSSSSRPSSSSTSQGSSSSSTSSSPTSTQTVDERWIDPSQVSPPYFQSFVRHQADVYHTLINLSSAFCFSSKDGEGYMSFLRPIVPDDAPPIEVLRASEKQLMARLYFWLILRGAKAWIMPLDHGLSKPSFAERIAAPESREQDHSDMSVETTLSPNTSSPTVSLSPPSPPQEPPQALLGEGAFPSFSHLIAYLLRMQNQPRRRERGVLPRSSPSKYVSGIARWRPTVSSPLRWTVVTGLYDEDEEDAREVAESLLETIEEEDSIMEEGSESWFDMLGELDDEDMGREADEEDDIDEEMDEDDREWARLRFQMAMDIERRTWSGADLDLDRSKMGTLDRPGSPTPDSLGDAGSQRSTERHAGDVEQYVHVQVSSPMPIEQPLVSMDVPQTRPTANPQKRSLSDSDLLADEALSAKRRRLSAVEFKDTTSSSGHTDDRHTKSHRRPVERKSRRSGSRVDVSGGRKLRRRVSGSSLGGSVAAL